MGSPRDLVTAQTTNIAPARVRPWTQTRPLGLPRTRTSRRLQVAAHATQIKWLPVAAWPTDINMALGSSIYHGHPMAFGGNSDHDINADPSCSRIPDPDMALCGSSGLDISMTSHCGSPGRSDQYEPWGQHSLQAST